jgi:hypothetical protein
MEDISSVKNKKTGFTSVNTELLILRTILLSPPAKDGYGTRMGSPLMLIHNVNHFYVTSFPFPAYMQDRVGYREQDDHKTNPLSRLFLVLLPGIYGEQKHLGSHLQNSIMFLYFNEIRLLF